MRCSLSLTHTFSLPVPHAYQEPYWLWVAEAVQVLFPWRFWQDDDSHYWRGFHLPERIFRLHWPACHHSPHRQVLIGPLCPTSHADSLTFSFSHSFSENLGFRGSFPPKFWNSAFSLYLYFFCMILLLPCKSVTLMAVVFCVDFSGC